MAARPSLQGLPVGRPGIDPMHLSVKAWSTNQLTAREFLIISFFFFFFNFWLCWVFVAACGLSQVVVSRGYSLLAARGLSYCSGFSCDRAQALECVGFCSCSSQALECGLSSCGAWASLPQGTWDLPGLRMEMMSPALAGGFLTTEPPGRPLNHFLIYLYSH